MLMTNRGRNCRLYFITRSSIKLIWWVLFTNQIINILRAVFGWHWFEIRCRFFFYFLIICSFHSIFERLHVLDLLFCITSPFFTLLTLLISFFWSLWVILLLLLVQLGLFFLKSISCGLSSHMIKLRDFKPTPSLLELVF